MAVHLKQSKTDPFGAGVTVCLGIQIIFYVRCVSMLAYLAVSAASPRPLFILNVDDWNTLSRDRLVDLLRHALRETGLDTSQHSFRIGAATKAARAGLQDSFIQTLGRWKSSAFTSYIQSTLQLFQPFSKICLIISYLQIT